MLNKNLVFASDYILKASSLLKEVHPEIADTLLFLSKSLYEELPLEEREKISQAEKKILYTEEDTYGRC